MPKQTLTQALHLARTGKDRQLRRAARRLHGLPEGGWAETEQAMREIMGLLPFSFQRDYTLGEWVAATHYVVPDKSRPGRSAGRWATRIMDA